jgi:GWxTD domain-containing protein
MTLHRAITSICVGLLILLPARGQERSLQLNVDYAQFRGSDDSLYVEMYYSFPGSALTYVEGDQGYLGSVELSVTVTDDGSSTEPVESRVFKMNYNVADTTAPSINQSVVGLSGLFLEPGLYRLTVVGYDTGNDEVRDSVSFPLQLKTIPEEHIALSDIQFANSIRQIPQEPENYFYKNTLEVIPNPSRIFGVGHPILFYYFEVYNLLAAAEEGEYTVTTAVYDAVGNQFHNRSYNKRRAHESSVEVGTVNTSGYHSGTYTLTITLLDPENNIHANASRRFFVYNPQHDITADGEAIPREGVIASVYSVMTEEELDTEFNRMRYITSSQDRQAYDRLETKPEKQQYLYEFWRRVDPDPASSFNPIRSEYLARVEHANEQFGFGFREGWRSDRGRVFIVYGPPDEYERYPSRSDTKPYEIWHYNNIQGGVVFIFVDRTGFQDYQLVHSTHRNELRDDNWQQYIRQN